MRTGFGGSSLGDCSGAAAGGAGSGSKSMAPKVTLFAQSNTEGAMSFGFLVWLLAHSEWCEVAWSTSQRPPAE